MFCRTDLSKSARQRLAVLIAVTLSSPWLAFGQPQRNPRGPSVPSIEEKTDGMRRIDGFFPLYWDAARGQLWMEIARWETDVLHAAAARAALLVDAVANAARSSVCRSSSTRSPQPLRLLPAPNRSWKSRKKAGLAGGRIL